MIRSAFGKEYNRIYKEVAAVHWIWQNFRELFANSKSDFELFNKRLPGFAYLAQKVLSDAVILRICRLADPADTKYQKNLSFEQLRNVLAQKQIADAKKLKWFDKQLQKINGDVAKLRKHRHKRLAHIDLNHSLSRSNKLPRVTRKTIETALKRMAAVMNRIESWKGPHRTEFDRVNSVGDADQLIECIRQSNRLYELQNDAHFGHLSIDEVIAKLKLRKF